MSRYHINPATGDPGPCKAMVSCPFGDLETEHYEDRDSALRAYEAAQASPFALKSAPYPAFLTDEVIRKIPKAQDGSTFEENWARTFKVLTLPPATLPAAFIRAQMGDPNFGRERGEPELVRFKPEEFNPSWDDENELYPNLSSGLYPPDAPEAKDLELMATIYTRNGGGNRECWCEDETHPNWPCTAQVTEDLEAREDFVHSWDDPNDQTYATFLFRIEENDEAQAVMANSKLAEEQARARQILTAIEKGERSALTVMPRNEDTYAKLVKLKQKHLAETVKWRNQQEGPTSHLRSATLLNLSKATELKKILDTTPLDWDDRQRARYRELTGVHPQSLTRDLERLERETRAARLRSGVAEELESGKLGPSAIELLGGEAEIKSAKVYHERRRHDAEEPFRSTRTRVGRELKHHASSDKVKAETERLTDALHWPKTPASLPEIFKTKTDE